METRRNTRSRRACRCTRSSLPFSSSLLFLFIILPASSFAQLDIRQNAPSSTSTPTTLITSTTPVTSSSLNPTSANPSSNPTNTPPPTLITSNPPPSQSSDVTIPAGNEHVFNYYFLIIAVVAVIACLCILYIGRRKKQKQAILRSNSQRALARDVEGFRSRRNRGPTRSNPWAFGGFGIGGHNAGNTEERVEGLDERGEAPPPYVPGGKPPSLRSVNLNAPPATEVRRSSERSSSSSGEAVELRSMSGDGRETGGTHPPEYHTAVSSEDIADVTRPTTAVTASDRFGSMRRLISSTGSTTHS